MTQKPTRFAEVMRAKLIGDVEQYGDASHQCLLEERYDENADLSILHRRSYAPIDVPRPQLRPATPSERGLLRSIWHRIVNIGEYDLDKTR